MSPRNVGSHDAGVRGVAGVVLLLSTVALVDRPLLALAVGFIGVIIIGTAWFRVCPLYTLLRINSR